MGNRNLIALGIAVVLGLLAVYMANIYFSGVQSRQERIAEQNKLTSIVVASQELAFGAPLGAQNVRMASWPSNSVPAGAFTSIEEATKNRVALRPIVTGEPILASKVSGTDGRATISSNLPAGKLAVAVPINDVAGVGGFVRPGDLVDVLLTRPIPGDGAHANDKMTDVLLQAVPVIGIDQIADEKNTNPAVGKTATLQVDTIEAQKLALAVQLGPLSLALRNVVDQDRGAFRTVTPRDLSTTPIYIAARANRPAAPSAAAMMGAARISASLVQSGLAPPRPTGPTMTVIRGIASTQYEVHRGY